METTNQSIFAQATQVFTDIKEAIGLVDPHPQKDVKHNKAYLDDIANGRWNSLRHVETIERTDIPWGGQAGQFSLKKINYKPLFNSIHNYKAVQLHHVDTVDKSQPLLDNQVKFDDISNRHKDFLNEVSTFDSAHLKHAQISDKSVPSLKTVDLSSKVFEEAPKQNLVQDFLRALRTSPSLNQAKEFLSESIETVKEVIGFNEQYPQAHLQHNRPWLNDIARGEWSTLRPVQTIDKSTLNYWYGDNLPPFKLRMINANVWLSDIRNRGVVLNRAQTRESGLNIESGWKLKNIGNTRKDLWSEIQHFNRGSLKHIQMLDKGFPRVIRTAAPKPKVEETHSFFSDFVKAIRSSPSVAQATEFIGSQVDNVKGAVLFSERHPQYQVQHKKEYLNDIANGRWKELKSVETEDKSRPLYWAMKWGKAKIESGYTRRALWDEIKAGQSLHHVETMDKGQPNLEMAKTEQQRNQLLREITTARPADYQPERDLPRDLLDEIKEHGRDTNQSQNQMPKELLNEIRQHVPAETPAQHSLPKDLAYEIKGIDWTSRLQPIPQPTLIPKDLLNEIKQHGQDTQMYSPSMATGGQ